MTAERTRRILIVRFGSMGDIVHGLPVLAALKETFPSWEVDPTGVGDVFATAFLGWRESSYRCSRM